MLGLPRSTEVNLPFPKQKLYERAQMSATLKKKFIDQIESITWRNKLAVGIINVSKGAYVEELEIIELKLRAELVDDKVLRFIDKAIPYRLIFVLSRNDRYQLCAAYDDGSTVGKYFRTDWSDEPTLALNGLTLDEVYENFIRQIIGSSFSINEGETFKDALTRYEQTLKIEQEIGRLRRKIPSEKQFNRQLEMRGRLKHLQSELERLHCGSNGGQVGGRA